MEEMELCIFVEEPDRKFNVLTLRIVFGITEGKLLFDEEIDRLMLVEGKLLDDGKVLDITTGKDTEVCDDIALVIGKDESVNG